MIDVEAADEPPVTAGDSFDEAYELASTAYSEALAVMLSFVPQSAKLAAINASISHLTIRLRQLKNERKRTSEAG